MSQKICNTFADFKQSLETLIAGLEGMQRSNELKDAGLKLDARIGKDIPEAMAIKDYEDYMKSGKVQAPKLSDKTDEEIKKKLVILLISILMIR
jgi:hypothetical protein